MEITRVSMISKKENTLDLDVTSSQIEAWRCGLLIQEAMPNLTSDEREFIVSGITKDEWDNVFGDDENEDYEFPEGKVGKDYSNLFGD